MDLLLTFLLEHAEEFGTAGVFIALVCLYFARKFWKLSKWQRTRIRELEGHNAAVEKDYREYIKESLPPGIAADYIKEGTDRSSEILDEVQRIHRDLHRLRLTKRDDGSIYLAPDDNLSHDPHSDDR